MRPGRSHRPPWECHGVRPFSLPGSSRSGEKATKMPDSFVVRATLRPSWISILQDWHHDLFGRAGIRSAFEDNELPIVNVRGDDSDRSGDVAEVGFVIFIQRRGDADDDRVHSRDFGIVGRGAEAGLLCFLDHLRKNANNVGAALVQNPTLSCAISKPVTSKRSALNNKASGNPTYPIPTIPIRACRTSIFSLRCIRASACAIVILPIVKAPLAFEP